MKIGQRNVVIGFGKNKPWPRKYWVVASPLGREWIPPGVAQRDKGFWLPDVPRRVEVYGPTWFFMLALTPSARWSGGPNYEEPKWIEWSRR